MTKRIVTFVLCLALILAVGGEALLSAFAFKANAAVITYSDITDDLRADSSFDISNYPLMSYDTFNAVNTDDNPNNNVDFIQVIQIAEGEDNELFVYTYQPLNNVSDITASSITFAIEESALKDMAIKNDTKDFKKYSLKCVSFDGSLKKYLVEDFEVGDGYYRYYCISEIERPFDTLFDEKINDATITNYKGHAVGQAWCCYYYDNTLQYEMVTLDVVDISPTHTGSGFYEGGVTWGSLVGVKNMCESHYISFNVDNYKVDKIIDASLVYKYREYSTVHTLDVGIAPTIQSWFGKDVEHTVTSYPNGVEYKTQPLDIHETDEVTYEGKGLFAKEYSWNRIMTGSDFVEKSKQQGASWSESYEKIVKNSQYVFAFCETPLETWQTSSTSGNGGIGSTTTYISTVKGTEIAQVDVLRLKFVSNGVIYNLGVVGDTTSSDGKADFVADGLDYSKDWEKIFALIGLIIALLLVIFFFGPVITVVKIIFTAIKFILSLLYWVVSLPFKLIALFLRQK